jgi:hypothetical protein
VGEWNQEDHSSRLAWAKKFSRPHFTGKKLGIVLQACHPSYGEKCSISLLWFRLSWAQCETLSPKITGTKRAGGYGSSQRAPSFKV